MVNGEKIGYCKDAVYYDEQPVKFSTSWHQRMRWARGYLQVFGKYGGKLLKGVFRKGGFACFDMTMNIMPAIILTAFSIIINGVAAAVSILNGHGLIPALLPALQTLGNMYLLFAVLGGITTIAQWRKIDTAPWKRVAYIFTFPLFMITYIPISFVAIFKRVEWKHIEHNVSVSISDLQQTKVSKDTTKV